MLQLLTYHHRALDVTMPRWVFVRADEFIE